MSKSTAEASFAFQCKAVRLRVEREFRFCERRWRFDFAWPREKVALEIHGGVWTGGRHVRGKGIIGDMDKSNRAVLMGWRVLTVTPEMVETGAALRLVESVLELFAQVDE